MDFVYTVWFRDTSAKPDDQDYEWPACIVINAENIEDATAWGDHLSTQYSARYPYEKFLRSYSEPPEKYAIGGISSLPRIRYGHEATDDEIGW